MSKNIESDIAIIGAGASGLIAAIIAKRANVEASVLLLNSTNDVGEKVRLSGGGRCNLTNRSVKVSDYCGGAGHFVRHTLEGFSPEATRRFFEGIGVLLACQPDGKYFPKDGFGTLVAEALVREIQRLGVGLETGVKIRSLLKKESTNLLTERFFLRGDSDPERSFSARCVIVATGGLSYPRTGSDGSGYSLAAQMHHTLQKTSPALTPFLTSDPHWRSLSGITLNTRLCFFKDEKKSKESAGSFLFTHRGFSGPAVFNLSRYYTSCDKKNSPEIRASFLPEETPETLKRKIERCVRSDRKVKNFIVEEFLLPTRLAEVLIKKSGFLGHETMKICRPETWRNLIRHLTDCPLDVSAAAGYEKAEVTAGGVNLDELRPQTMESRLVRGLYFAGEILDVDGKVGGYNLQWAWSSGAIAGRAAARSLLQRSS